MHPLFPGGGDAAATNAPDDRGRRDGRSCSAMTCSDASHLTSSYPIPSRTPSRPIPSQPSHRSTWRRSAAHGMTEYLTSPNPSPQPTPPSHHPTSHTSPVLYLSSPPIRFQHRAASHVAPVGAAGGTGHDAGHGTVRFRRATSQRPGNVTAWPPPSRCSARNASLGTEAEWADGRGLCVGYERPPWPGRARCRWAVPFLDGAGEMIG